MQSVVIHRPGGHGRLVLETRPDPVPSAGEVLVRVRAAGVNYADCVVRMGLYESAKKYVGYPITPGFEFAGEVLASRDPAWSPGAPVYGVTRFGAYATHVCVPGKQLRRALPGLSHATLATVPAASLTAWWAACELASVRAGDPVLVHSAAGGVGSVLVAMMARGLGADVIGVVGRAEKAPRVRALGARDVLVRKDGAWVGEARRCLGPRDGYAAVFDANGPATLRDSYRLLGQPGRLVVYGFHTLLPETGGVPNPLRLAAGWLRIPRFDPLEMTGTNRSVMAFNLSYLFERYELLAPGLERIESWLASGALPPPEPQVFPLSRVAEAHAALESGTTTGKLALAMPD